MKPTANLVNIARGGIVDDAALAAALREKRIAAAGLDVFEGEPKVHPDLLTVPNVVLTPHIASATVPTRRAMANLAADNLIGFLVHGKPLTPLNPEVLQVGKPVEIWTLRRAGDRQSGAGVLAVAAQAAGRMTRRASNCWPPTSAWSASCAARSASRREARAPN